ncbi:MAG: DUF484 family protein [Pseudomonadota bacterium]|nr:DUF484 family protein [Pseudomonadota bacterium]
MPPKNGRDSAEELVIQFLKKNKNFFINYPRIIGELNFPDKTPRSEKIIDLSAYRSKKISSDNARLKKQMLEILKAGKSHMVAQKRILQTSLKILNTKSLSKLIDVMVNDLGTLLACDLVNCFFTSNTIQHKYINQIDNRMATSYFRDKPQTYLNQNPKGIPLFFPNKSKIIKSYILLKIVFGSDRFIVAMGSKNINKFTKDQQVNLVEYLIQIIQIRLTQID